MDDNRVLCPKCGEEMGKIINVEGFELLETGGGLARYYHGMCKYCMTEFHWSVSDRLLAKLVRRMAKSQN